MEGKFQLVDAAYCFLTRHRAPVTAKNVIQMANSLGGGGLTLLDLQRMAALVPEMIHLGDAGAQQQHHRDDMFQLVSQNAAPEETQHLRFTGTPQASARASKKRQRIFAQAILNELTRKGSGSQKDAGVVNTDASGASETADTDCDGEQSATLPASEETNASPQPPLPSSHLVDLLRSIDIYDGQIVHVESRPARAALTRSFNDLKLPPALVSALIHRGIQSLYSHQYESIQGTLAGDNVVISTATASGKSLVFTIPTLTHLLDDPQSTFLYLFPTKALAQDQLKSLRALLMASGLPGHLCSAFDGDTPMKARSMVIRETQIFLTNPDIMHLSILPKHTQWRRVLTNLKLIVVDEAHMYRGVFGSHVANVFRRLFRLCALYGSNPCVICCSATVRNPAEHFHMLLPKLLPRHQDRGQQDQVAPPQFDFFFDRPLRVITNDGAPTGEKLICLWNPHVRKNADELASISTQIPTSTTVTDAVDSTRKRKRSGHLAILESPKSTAVFHSEAKGSEAETAQATTSPVFQSAKILARFVEHGVHTIMFCKGRKLSELVLMTTHSLLGRDESTRKLIKRVHTYRGGYSADDRRRIERRLFEGDLVGVIATNALELGIDIGELDCSLHLGFPPSIASLWQQAGRAGRQHTRTSLAIVVCFDSPLDQHFARHARDLFTLMPEAVILNANNPKILSQHLVCAAHEHALFNETSGLVYVDNALFGENGVIDVLSQLVEQKLLLRCPAVNGATFCVHSCAPKSYREINLRDIADNGFSVVTDTDDPVVIDTIPGEKVFLQVYPTAVYLHQGREHIITRIDVEQRIAFARQCEQVLTYFTTCRDVTQIDIVKVKEQSKWQQGGDTQQTPHLGSVIMCEGKVSISIKIFGSRMVEKRTLRVLQSNDFSLPPMQSFGNAVWIEFPSQIREQVEEASFVWAGALHGAGHLLLIVAPLFVLCDPGDINTQHYNPFENHDRSSCIMIYEQREGGSGIVNEIARVLPRMINKAWTIARECACVKGCPSCIHLAQCSEYNSVLDKRGCLLVLELLAKVVCTGPAYAAT